MKYIPLGRGRAFMVNPAFAKHFGIPLDDELVVETPTEYKKRLREVDKEVRREQRAVLAQEVTQRNLPVATAFSAVLNRHTPDKEKLSRLIVIARSRKDKDKLPPNLSLAHCVLNLATKGRRSVAERIEGCAKIVRATLSLHKRFQDSQ